MKKYFTVFKTSFKQETKTIVNSLIAVASFAVIIFIFYELWSFIYGKGGGELIKGYDLNMMIWYLIMAEILMYAQNSVTVTRTFGDDIKSGKVAYGLNKPYNYFTYQVANQTGVFVYKLLFLIPTGVILGLLLLGPSQSFSAAYIVPIIASLLLATLLTCLIFGTIGLLCFWIEEATPFTWIIAKFVMIFGLFFPPEFFPVWLQPFINYSPIFAMISGPSKLLANFSWQLFGELMLSQLSYIVFFYLLGLLLFKLGSKKVNVNGG